MSARFSGTGNLGTAPALRHVQVDGEARAVADMRVFFDRPVKQDDDSYADGGGIWLTVSVWGWRAKAATELLPKGARVFAQGRLRTETWEDDDGEAHSQLRLDADYLTVDLVCLEGIELRRHPPAEGEAGE